MTITDLEQKLAETVKKWERYNNVQNEGYDDSYNPHTQEIADIQDQICALRKEAAETLLQGEKLKEEIAWFNGQKFSNAQAKEANEACRARGYEMCYLFAAAKKSKENK